MISIKWRIVDQDCWSVVRDYMGRVITNNVIAFLAALSWKSFVFASFVGSFFFISCITQGFSEFPYGPFGGRDNFWKYNFICIWQPLAFVFTHKNVFACFQFEMHLCQWRQEFEPELKCCCDCHVMSCLGHEVEFIWPQSWRILLRCF